MTLGPRDTGTQGHRDRGRDWPIGFRSRCPCVLRSLCPSVLFLLAILVLPLVGHGCHGDDLDHEPGVAPPVRAVVVHHSGAKTSQ